MNLFLSHLALISIVLAAPALVSANSVAHRNNTPPEEAPEVTETPAATPAAWTLPAFTVPKIQLFIPTALTAAPATAEAPEVEKPASASEALTANAVGDKVSDKPTHSASGGATTEPPSGGASGGSKALSEKEKRYLDVGSLVATTNQYLMEALGKKVDPNTLPRLDTDWIRPGGGSGGTKLDLARDIGTDLSVNGSPFLAQAAVVDLQREVARKWGSKASADMVSAAMAQAAYDLMLKANAAKKTASNNKDLAAVERLFQNVYWDMENRFSTRVSKKRK